MSARTRTRSHINDDRFFLFRDTGAFVADWNPIVPVTSTEWTQDGLIVNGDQRVELRGVLFKNQSYPPNDIKPPIWSVDVVHIDQQTRVLKLTVDIFVCMHELVSCWSGGLNIPGRKLLMQLCRCTHNVDCHADNYILRKHAGGWKRDLLVDHSSSHSQHQLRAPTATSTAQALKTKLFDFQYTSVQHMCNAETTGFTLRAVDRKYARLAANGAELFVGRHADLCAREDCEEYTATVRGGLFCDKMGMGKTLSLIALSSLSPQCTLVLCPSHVVSHWVAEIHKHTNIPVLSFSTVADTKRITVGQIHGHMFCVVSFSLFTNKSYREHDDRYGIFSGPTVETHNRINNMRCDHERRNEHDKQNTTFHPHLFDWHRVIVDEFHELGQPSNTGASAYVACIHGHSKWLVSGTPNVNLDHTLPLIHTSFFGDHPIPHQDAISAIFTHCVVRNARYCVDLPDVVHEVQWVQFSSTERQLYDALHTEGRAQQLRVCAYPRLAHIITNTTPMQEVESIEDMRAVAVAHLHRRTDRTTTTIHTLEQRLHEVDQVSSDSDRSRTRIQQLRRELVSEIERHKTQLQALQRTATYVQNAQTTDCPVCLEPLQTPALLKGCGHYLCRDCATRIYQSRSCPSCRAEIVAGDVITLATKHTTDIERSYGSKLAQLMIRVKDTAHIKTLIFSQFDDLLRDVGKCLEKVSKVLYCRGNVMQKRSSISKFTRCKDHNLLLLSTLNSASGCDLSVATRVIMLDTIDGTRENVRGTEAQAIARCHRIGQTSPVTVVRFLVRDTIEQEIYESVYAL
jgi:SNF2 family DNA or RNA helicase